MPTIIPTHTVVGHFTRPDGSKVRSTAIKFAATPGNEEAAAKVALAFLIRKPGYTLTDMGINKLKPAKHTVKVNEQHEYITITANFLDGRCNLTTSYGGAKMSGDFVSHEKSRPLFAAFNKIINTSTGKGAGMMISLGTDNSDTVGARVKRVAALAEANDTFEAFADAVIKLAA